LFVSTQEVHSINTHSA